QRIVVGRLLPGVEARDPVGVPAAVADIAAKAPAQSIKHADGRPISDASPNAVAQLWRHPLVGIDHQYPVARGMPLRPLPLHAEARPVFAGKHFGAMTRGD